MRRASGLASGGKLLVCTLSPTGRRGLRCGFVSFRCPREPGSCMCSLWRRGMVGAALEMSGWTDCVSKFVLQEEVVSQEMETSIGTVAPGLNPLCSWEEND